jgi:hypothetical protein
MALPHYNCDYTDEQDDKIDFLKHHDLQERPFPALEVLPYREERKQGKVFLLYALVIHPNGWVEVVKP